MTSPKLPVLCQVGCKTLTSSISNQTIFHSYSTMHPAPKIRAGSVLKTKTTIFGKNRTETET